MIELNAMQLEKLPISGLRHVRDLIEHDGPLLSLYRHPNGDNFLYYWCDCDETANRWMVLRVAETSVLRLVNAIIPLDFVIPKGCRDDFVYYLDIAADGSSKAYLGLKGSVPEAYRPSEGCYLEPQRADEGTHYYTFLIDGKWSVEAMGNFPKTFTKMYSLIYGMNVLHTQLYPSHPWRGGFSSMHFFDDAKKRIPSEDKPVLESMQKSSPGFMRFSLDVKTAEQVVRCVVIYKSRQKHIDWVLAKSDQYIRRNKLNDIHDPKDERWVSHSDRLEYYTKLLLKDFKVIDREAFLKVCSRSFEAAKIAMTFVRYVKDLVRFESDGLVQFPRV